MVQYLPKKLIGRKGKSMETATSMLQEDFLQKIESLNLDPRLKKLPPTQSGGVWRPAASPFL